MKKISIREEDVGLRLDKVLVDNLSDFSRTQIKTFIDNGDVLVNKVKSKAGYLIKNGDKVVFTEPLPTELVIPKSLYLEAPIVWEGDDFFVIDKPAALAVYPQSLNSAGGDVTVRDLFADKFSDELKISDPLRMGIVHRLDRDTSGLLILAKKLSTRDLLMERFKKRLMRKKYLALVVGVPEHSSGVIDSPMMRDVINRKRMAVSVDSEAKKAVTSYQVLEDFAVTKNIRVSLVELYPKTGRTHQIRVHMAAIGCPVVGDNLYGNQKVNTYFQEKFGLKRQFLHAAELSFSGARAKKMAFSSLLRPDLKKVLTLLGANFIG